MDLTARAKSGTLPATLLVVALLAALPFAGLPARGEEVVTRAMIYGTAAIALDLFAGYSGQFSFGHFAFLGIGAYATTIFRARLGLSFGVAAALAMVACAAVALPIGAAMVRLPHLGSALTTFFFAFITSIVLSSNTLSDWTGGVNGLYVPPLTMSGLDFSGGLPLYALAWCALLASALATGAYVGSRAGRALRLIKRNEVVASVLGVGVRPAKLACFLYSAAVAGLAGAILSLAVGYLAPDSFAPQESVTLFAMVAVGGFGTIAGPILGALFFTAIPEMFLAAGASRAILFSAALLVSLIFLPSGLYGVLEAGILIMRQRLLPGRKLPISERGSCHSVPRETAGPVPVEGSGCLLEAVDVSVRIGGMEILTGVSFALAPNSVHAVIGPNGAGKTTFLNVLSGIQRLDGGTIKLAGENISGLSPQARARRGIARTYQHPALVPDLSVRDNVRLGCYAREQRAGLLSSFAQDRRSRVSAEAALDAVEFPARRRTLAAADLTLAEQKILDIVRAMAGQPRVLLMDEPSAGLSEHEMHRVARVIRDMRARRDVAMIIIAHHVSFVAAIADEITALHLGAVLAQGRPADVVAAEKVREVFIGA